MDFVDCGFVFFPWNVFIFPPKTMVDWVIIYVIGKELFFYLISVALPPGCSLFI